MPSEIILHNEKPVPTSSETACSIDRKYIIAATSDNTRRAYQSDIHHFIEWGGLLPTSAEIIMNYLNFGVRHFFCLLLVIATNIMNYINYRARILLALTLNIPTFHIND